MDHVVRRTPPTCDANPNCASFPCLCDANQGTQIVDSVLVKTSSRFLLVGRRHRARSSFLKNSPVVDLALSRPSSKTHLSKTSHSSSFRSKTRPFEVRARSSFLAKPSSFLSTPHRSSRHNTYSSIFQLRNIIFQFHFSVSYFFFRVFLFSVFYFF